MPLHLGNMNYGSQVVSRRRRGRTAGVFALFFLGGCTTESPPRTAHDPGSGDSLGISGELLPAGKGPEVTIGILDGEESKVFGEIRDLAVSPDGSVLVLDGQAPDLRWFGPDGRLKGRAGRRGSGPGEFREPFDVTPSGGRQVMVTDGPLRKISIFSLGVDGLRLEEDVSMGRWVDQLCLLDSGYLVLDVDPEENTLLHRLDSNRQTTLSFGELLNELPPEVAATGYQGFGSQNFGKLLCDKTTQMAFFLHGGLPFIRAFDREGREVWRRRLSGHHGTHFSVVEGGWIRQGADPSVGWVDQERALFPWGPDTLAISTLRADYRTGKISYEVRLVQAATGMELTRLIAPMVVAWKDATRFYGFINDPFPQVLIYGR